MPQRIETPSEFRQHLLEPAYRAFLQNPTNLNRATQAASPLFALRDWVAGLGPIEDANAERT